MKVRQWITGIVLLLLVVAAIAGMVWTRDCRRERGDSTTRPKRPGTEGTRGAASAGGPASAANRQANGGTRRHAEEALAHEAEKVGDHEVDLAFFDALRTAEENPPPLSPETKTLAVRKEKAEQALKEDQEEIAQLTRKLAAAPEAQKDNLQDQIDVAKAQMDLDQDEVDDAAEDLEQAGGDPQAKIKRLKAEHDASDQLPRAPRVRRSALTSGTTRRTLC